MMPEAKLLVAVLSRGFVSTPWAMALREMIFPEGTKIIPSYGHSVADQRNNAVQTFLGGDYTHLLFLDDDVMAPPDSVAELLGRKLDIVSGLYYMRQEPLHPLAFKSDDGISAYPVDFKIGDLVEVDFCGAGCLLIARKVLDGMPYPWFRYDLHRMDLLVEQRVSEDGFFIQKAKKLGWKTYVDTNVRCVHLGLGRAELGGIFSPLSNAQAPSPGFSTGSIQKWIAKAKARP